MSSITRLPQTRRVLFEQTCYHWISGKSREKKSENSDDEIWFLKKFYLKGPNRYKCGRTETKHEFCLKFGSCWKPYGRCLFQRKKKKKAKDDRD